MPAPIFVAAHYTITVNSVNVGTTETGFNIEPVFYREDIKIDDYGDTIVDGIYRGYNMRLTFELVEADFPTVQAVRFPFDAGTYGTLQGIGKLVSSFAVPIVFSPVVGINAKAKTYTFGLCVPDGNHGGFLLANKLQRTRGSFLVLPDLTTNVGRLFAIS